MRPKTFTLLVAVSMLATACFRADMTIRVNDDGSGEIESLVALNVDAALELNDAFATEGVPEVGAGDLCDEFGQDQDVPEGATVTPYEEDGFCGVSYRLAFGPDEFQEAILEASDGGQFLLRRDGDGWYFETDLTSEDLGGGELGGGEFGSDVGADPFTESLLDGAEMTIGVLLPGRLVDHNASYIDTDGTAVWKIDLTATSTNVFARSEPGERVLGPGADDGGGTSVAAVVAVLVLLAIVGLVIWLVVKRRNELDQGTGPSSPQGAAAAPPGAPGSPVSSLPPPPGDA